jgi:hypothetical protein
MSTRIMCRLGAEIELRAEIERLYHIQGNHVHAFYIHNIYGWSKFFCFVACYYLNLDKNRKTIN